MMHLHKESDKQKQLVLEKKQNKTKITLCCKDYRKFATKAQDPWAMCNHGYVTMSNRRYVTLPTYMKKLAKCKTKKILIYLVRIYIFLIL
jgi:hypothetical protein